MEISKLSVFLLLFALGTSGSLRVYGSEAEPVKLTFDNPLPNSFFKHVKKLCMEVWGDVDEQMTPQAIAQGDFNAFVENMVDRLLAVHAGLECMLRYAKEPVLNEDLEYLIVVLHFVEREYLDITRGETKDDVACARVLLQKLKRRLGQTLTASG